MPRIKNRCRDTRFALRSSPAIPARPMEDIVNTLNRRWPVAAKLLVPVRGPGRCRAGRDCRGPENRCTSYSRRRAIDVMLLARGGGSLEDLWAFNDVGRGAGDF